MQLVKDVMTSNPRTAQVNEPLLDVLNVMKQVDTGIVPITDERDIVKGIITDRDIALYLADNADKSLQELTAKDLLKESNDIVSVSPEDTLQEALQQMEKHQLRRILVTDEQKYCVGILSQADIARDNTNPYRTAELVQEVSQGS
jgi:CBS domain-containing protein